MLKNYLIVTLRNIKKHKGYSLINIVGLAIGMACCIILFLWVQDELSFDSFHPNADQIYRVIGERHTKDTISLEGTTSNPLAPALKAEFPEVVNSARFCGGFLPWLVQYENKSSRSDRLATADPSLFEIFSFPFVKGDPRTALIDNWTVVVSESMAKKYFGNDDPMNKVIKIELRDFKITGVFKDVPSNSSLQFDYIFSLTHMEFMWDEPLNDWSRDFKYVTFVQLQKNATVPVFNQKISGFIKRFNPYSNISRIFLQPLADIHLKSSDLESDLSMMGKGNLTFVFVFSLIGLCILFMACINYINLATARISVRAKEIGLRKVVGANRINIIKQFFGESVILSIMALVVAILLVYLALPVFNNLASKSLTLGVSASFIWGVLAITLLTTLASGIYPALFLSAFQPVSVIKGMTSTGKSRGAFLRKILVVVQFTFTAILIIATFAIYSQLNYIRNKDLGFDKKNVLIFEGIGSFRYNTESAKSELRKNPNILDATVSSPPSFQLWGAGTNVQWEGKNPEDQVRLYPVWVDVDYQKTFKLKMAEGRFFSREYATDYSNYIINETAAKAMRLDSPVGKTLTYSDSARPTPASGTIIGVIKDYHIGSLHEKIHPLILMHEPGYPNYCIRISDKNMSETIRYIEQKWKNSIPMDMPFSYSFLDEELDKNYVYDRKIGEITRYTTFLSIFISFLGLLGLVSFTAEQKTKQIGIRKILGASVLSINLLLSKEFLWWVLLANLIAAPFAWFAVNHWLQNFAYHITLGWWIFPLTCIITLLMTMFTTIYKIFKISRLNPIVNLRYE